MSRGADTQIAIPYPVKSDQDVFYALCALLAVRPGEALADACRRRELCGPPRVRMASRIILAIAADTTAADRSRAFREAHRILTNTRPHRRVPRAAMAAPAQAEGWI